MAKVKVTLKDPGTKITIKGRKLFGRNFLIVEDDSELQAFRKSGLIAVEPVPEKPTNNASETEKEASDPPTEGQQVNSRHRRRNRMNT